MGKNLNVSIVLFNSEFTQIDNLVKGFRTNKAINQIYLVDNSPTINKTFEKCDANYIFTGKNLGYGIGHNIAIKKTLHEGIKYHLVLNPDIYIETTTLNDLLHYMNENEDVGLVMPQIRYPNGQTQYLCKLLATPFDLIGRRFLPFKQIIRKRNNIYELRFTGYDKLIEVPSLSGCFMFFRTDTLKKVDGFDERFFMYCEDLDLSRRIGQISKTVFYPKVSIIHNYEKGSYKDLKLLIYHITSAIKYFNKWGWFFDKERKRINRKVLKQLEYKK